MKRILCSLPCLLLVATLPFGSVLAQAPKENPWRRLPPKPKEQLP